MGGNGIDRDLPRPNDWIRWFCLIIIFKIICLIYPSDWNHSVGRVSNGMKIVSKSLIETEKISKDFVEKLTLATYDGAAIIGLYGDLGSGKTTFSQYIAKILGAHETVTSPTFVIEKKYDINPADFFSDKKSSGKHPFFKKLIHIDAYRLESPKEMLALDWNEISFNPHNIILVEWPERIADILPKNHAKIFFKFISENEREIEI